MPNAPTSTPRTPWSCGEVDIARLSTVTHKFFPDGWARRGAVPAGCSCFVLRLKNTHIYSLFSPQRFS